jgi:peptidoglycan biosynthesis protein MviN/MurJ (putative lipid II flippase)
MNRLLRHLRPSHQHSAFSATVLLMSAVMASRVIGYVREAYIAWAFGAGPQTDAYVAGFTIPDWLNYLVAGGTASITFVSIYTRFLAEKKEEDAQKTFSIIITVMTVVLGIGTALAEIFTPQIERHLFSGFTPDQLALCVHLTRILLLRRSSSTSVALSRQSCFPVVSSYSLLSVRCSTTWPSSWAEFCSPIAWASPRSLTEHSPALSSALS